MLLWVFPLFLKRFPWVACTLKWYSHQQFYYTNQYIRKVFNNLIYSTKTWHIASTNELNSHLLPHTDVLRLGRNPITGIDSISLMFNDMLDTAISLLSVNCIVRSKQRSLVLNHDTCIVKKRYLQRTAPLMT
jgi:hypothetical protein